MLLLIAFLASATLHAVVMIGPDWALPDWSRDGAETRLDARLAPPPVPVPVPAKPKAPPRAAPRLAAAPVTTDAAGGSAAAAREPLGEEVAVAAAMPAATVPPAPTFFDPASVLAAHGRVRYLISRGAGGFVVGQAIHTWQRDDADYRLESVTETTGIAAVFKPARIVQQSRGEVTAAGLRPQWVHQEDKKGVSEASLDWATHRVAGSGRSEPLPAGTQDMLSMYYQLAWSLSTTLAADAPPLVELPILTRKAIETYRFERVGREALNYQQRALSTWHYRTRNGTDAIELWFAPELRGLPVLIRFIDRNGELFEQRAEAIELANDPSPAVPKETP